MTLKIVPPAVASSASDVPMVGREDILDRDTIGAFCRHTHVAIDGASKGPLLGRTFGVKDLYHVGGHRTGFGNPAWLASHPPADHTATAVRRLLDAGARMVGKTQTDELAYSLNGENRHYGTPVNPRAPQRLPGGSSSGSAAAVAGGLVEFALGSDTGGSVRVPASYCGLLGMRVTHGAVPLDGAIPFAPSFDTVGWFARDPGLFAQVGRVLLGEHERARAPRRLLIATDAFARADAAISAALQPSLDLVASLLGPPQAVRLSEAPLDDWMSAFRVIQAFEIWSTHGAWVSGLDPDFGGGIRERFAWASTITPTAAREANATRQRVRERMDELLSDDTVIALPTVVGIAPLLKTPVAELETWRNRCLGLLCIAGHAGLPQVSVPLATYNHCPVGLSLIAARGSDTMLLDLAQRLSSRGRGPYPGPSGTRGRLNGGES